MRMFAPDSTPVWLWCPVVIFTTFYWKSWTTYSLETCQYFPKSCSVSVFLIAGDSGQGRHARFLASFLAPCVNSIHFPLYWTSLWKSDLKWLLRKGNVLFTMIVCRIIVWVCPRSLNPSIFLSNLSTMTAPLHTISHKKKANASLLLSIESKK